MNFFESQDRVRKRTILLVILFLAAVLMLIIMTNVLLIMVLAFLLGGELGQVSSLIEHMGWKMFSTTGIGIVIVVLAGSLYKIAALSVGGKAVAQAMGGQLIPQNATDLNQRRLLNVVEEMAIASGTPAPPVYLLSGESSINAFAAGFSSRDAIIGVTQGTIEHLSREQLQGVIAHEFSHIFNGDMRLNIRLMGVLNGILIIGILGYYLLRSLSRVGRYRRSGKIKTALLGLAIGLMVIGFAGTFLGGLIKAMVSRQREFLADACAVQFTRNPNGIAGALKRIGGLAAGSTVNTPGALEISHAFFAQAVSSFMPSWSATHPPLAQRILRIDPGWDGKFDHSSRAERGPDEPPVDETEALSRQASATKSAVVMASATVASAISVMSQIGQLAQENVDDARALISELPAAIKDAAREPHGARAIIYSLVLDKNQQVRAQQLLHLKKHAEADVYGLTLWLISKMDDLDIKFRLPIIHIAIAALKQLSLKQYQSFKNNLTALIKVDSQFDLIDWSLQKIVINHLDKQFLKVDSIHATYSDLGSFKNEMALLLSMLAHAGNPDQSQAQSAFAAAVQTLKMSGLELMAPNKIRLADLDLALRKMEVLKPLAKSRFIQACVTGVWHDQCATLVEQELLRAFVGALDCPMPPTGRGRTQHPLPTLST